MKIALIIASLVGVSCSLCGEEVRQLAPAEARVLIEQMLETEKVMMQESHDFKLQQESLEKLLELYQLEKEQLEKVVGSAGESAEEDALVERGLKEQLGKQQKVRAQLDAMTRSQAQRLLQITGAFPAPLKMQLSQELEMLGSDGVRLRERVKAMHGVVIAALKFNQVVTYSEELQVVDGAERQVEALYFGLTYAYFTSGSHAGVAKLEGGKWVWSLQENAASRIREALAIYRKLKSPALVKLPVERAQ